jgi:hypothetical protein
MVFPAFQFHQFRVRKLGGYSYFARLHLPWDQDIAEHPRNIAGGHLSQWFSCLASVWATFFCPWVSVL